MKKYVTKDSGKRQEFTNGFVRDSGKNKPRFDLIWQPMLERWANLMMRGAEKYTENNWMLANSKDALIRFRASAYRHLYQWFNGLEPEEDHAAACFFNISAAEYLKELLGVETDGEIWEKPESLKGYSVSQTGKVKRDDGKAMSQWENVWGYKMVSVSGCERRHYQVHRVVMEAFVGEPLDKHTQVNHRDGDKKNNNLFNLEYVTPSENVKHAFDTGLAKPSKSQAKITYADAEEIRLRIDAGEKQKDLAKEFKISAQAINDLVRGRTWR